MKWKVESGDTWLARKKNKVRKRWHRESVWHQKFAWRPTRVADSTMAWLCWVERRLDGYSREMGKRDRFDTWMWDYEYRLPQKERAHAEKRSA